MTDFTVLIPDLQIAFYHRFREIENRFLGEALRNTVIRLDISILDAELAQLVKSASLRKVASFGLRGDLFFPVPYLLQANPYLLGYYRLLYGFSQKDFYSQGPFGSFTTLEERGEITPKVSDLIHPLCVSLIASGEMLVDGIDDISPTIIHSLQLITLGAFLRGSYLNRKGQRAVKDMYALIHSIIKPYITHATERLITIKNDSDRTVHIEFMNDPDIRVQGILQSGANPIMAIEIKGGTDVSNVYNRLGESEKSHRTARNLGFAECWTVINARLDLDKARQKSPSTTRFYYLFQITNESTPEYRAFKDQLCSLIGIKTN
jgi:hypothetical protein